jgi:hypothetical protein
LPSLELSPKVIPLGVEIPEVLPAVPAIKHMESNHKHGHLSYQKLESRTKVRSYDTIQRSKDKRRERPPEVEMLEPTKKRRTHKTKAYKNRSTPKSPTKN